MRLILIRHGETSENAAQIVQGQKPGRLSKKGKQQAQKAALQLKNEPIDIIYASDLARAYETALILANNRPGMTISKTPQLREQSFGIYEDEPVAKLMKDMKKADATFTSFSPDGGESPKQVYIRAKKFLDEINSRHINETVLLSTHHGVINALLEILVYNNPKTMFDKQIPNGAISIFNFDACGTVEVEAENDISYLKGI